MKSKSYIIEFYYEHANQSKKMEQDGFVDRVSVSIITCHAKIINKMALAVRFEFNLAVSDDTK